ncbi:MAG TPA: hypothetical protein V6C81_11625 [Planktothrix sp.]|jgi:hypothetical protein
MQNNVKLLRVKGPAADIERLDHALAFYDVEHPSPDRPITAMVQMTRKGDKHVYKTDWRGQFTVVVFDDSRAVMDWVMKTIEEVGFFCVGEALS